MDILFRLPFCKLTRVVVDGRLLDFIQPLFGLLVLLLSLEIVLGEQLLLGLVLELLEHLPGVVRSENPDFDLDKGLVLVLGGRVPGVPPGIEGRRRVYTLGGVADAAAGCSRVRRVFLLLPSMLLETAVVVVTSEVLLAVDGLCMSEAALVGLVLGAHAHTTLGLLAERIERIGIIVVIMTLGRVYMLTGLTVPPSQLHLSTLMAPITVISRAM